MIEVNEEATEWTRRYLQEVPLSLADYAREVPLRLRQNDRCVCCPDVIDVRCKLGHGLCEKCATQHGCLACALLG